MGGAHDLFSGVYWKMTKQSMGNLVPRCQVICCALVDTWAVLGFLYCCSSLLSISFHYHLYFVPSSPVNNQMLLANKIKESDKIVFFMCFEVLKAVQEPGVQLISIIQSRSSCKQHLFVFMNQILRGNLDLKLKTDGHIHRSKAVHSDK